MSTMKFWEARAKRYAGEGAGLRAVCSYAMPRFYNWSIDVSQRSALRSIIKSIPRSSTVLEYGCGVGRWTRELARRAAHVTAVDFSETMLAEARRRTGDAGLLERCRFIHSDISSLSLQQQFDVIIGVTVLQHVLNDTDLEAIIRQFSRALKPHGRLILVEAMPTHENGACDTQTFRARRLAVYSDAIKGSGLQISHIAGIDPAPFKLWVVPNFRRWPRPLALLALGLATLASLPVDLLLAPLLVRSSWHKIVVAVAPGARS